MDSMKEILNGTVIISIKDYDALKADEETAKSVKDKELLQNEVAQLKKEVEELKDMRAKNQVKIIKENRYLPYPYNDFDVKIMTEDEALQRMKRIIQEDANTHLKEFEKRIYDLTLYEFYKAKKKRNRKNG